MSRFRLPCSLKVEIDTRFQCTRRTLSTIDPSHEVASYSERDQVHEHARVCQNLFDMSSDPTRDQLAREAKAIVALSLRNGPIEDIHAGQPCPNCAGSTGYSRISDEEMRLIMRNAVNIVYRLLVLKEENPTEYEWQIRFGERYTQRWDDPDNSRTDVAGIPTGTKKSDEET